MSIEPSPFLDLQPSSSSARAEFHSADSTAPQSRHSSRSSLGMPVRLDAPRRDLGPALREKVKDLIQLAQRSEEHTSELQSPCNLVCRLLLEKKKPPTPTTQHN